ncbi:hypothetical protein WJX79_007041 [Trebouxia sp. C0005]
MFGSTGTGKTSLLEGRNGIAIDDDSTKTPGQEGLVQLISASLFDLLEEKQLSTGDKVAARRRLYQARGFEYFVDCTYVELFNESCSDLLRPEGQLVKDEDAATVSRLHVVDMAGAERLLVDPELLRQREGTQVNQSLLTFATILRKLAQGKPSHSVNQDASVLTKLLSEALGGNCLTTMIGTVRQGEWDRSLATLKHLVAAQQGMQVYNYPVVNHGRVRGLLQRLRSRLLHLQGERSALQQQLIQLPIEPDDSQAPLRNRIRSLQAQLADSRQEQKKQAADKAALQARLQAANDKSAAQDVEKGKLQASTEELIKSEEERLTVSQALLTMQLDLNKAQEEAENTKFALEQKSQELESRSSSSSSSYVSTPSSGQVRQTAAQQQLLLQQEQQQQLAQQELQKQLAELQREAADMQKQNEALLASRSEMQDTVADLRAQLQNQAGQLERAAALEGDLPAQQREADSLRSQLLEQQQANDHLQREATLSHIQLEESREAFRIRIQHCMLEAGDLQKACAIARDDPSSDLVPTQADFQERVQSLAAQLLQVQAQKDADAAHQIKELHARHAGLRHSLKALHAAYAQLRMRLEDVGQRGIHEDEVMGVSLDAALAKEEAAEQDVVSQLRLRAASLERDLLQRSWDGLAPSSKAVNRVMRRVTSEKEYKPLASVDHHKLQALDAENRRMQDELSKLRREMLRRQTYSFRDSSEMQHLQQGVARLRQERDAARMQRGDRPASPAKQALHKRPGGQGWLQSLEIENERLQGELDALRQRAATTPQHELRTKNERLVSQLRELERGDKTRAQLGYEVAALKQELDQMRRTSGKNSTAALRRQVKEFTLNTQMDLERQMAAMQSRALVAEEQLQSLQHYLAQSTVAYQKEIMRLRNMLSDSGSSSIKDLTEGLGQSLVSDDETERGRAALLLGEVVALASASVNVQPTQEHLVHFLSSRLADWPSVHGCLKGIAGLMSSDQGPPASNLLCPVVKALLNVHITALTQADRMLALTILRQALQSCGTLLVKGGIDVISGVIAAIDGEKDPRCLLLSFELSQQVVKIYESSPSVPAAQESLQANYEELFDVVACYFPISFTPPPNNVHGITREDLAGALQTTLTCTTLFTPLFIPMLVEKLSSTLRQAKLDALSALAAAAEAYGPDTMQPHLSAIWHALRGELLAPAAPGLLPTDCTSTQQIASKAAECLSKTAKALSQQGDEALAMKVLEDEQMCGDLLACLSGAKQHLSHDPARRVHATTQAIAAVAESSQAACKAACKRLLPNLAAAAATASASLSNSQHYSASRPADQTQRLALSTIFYLLKASNTLTAAGLCHHDPLAGTGSPLQVMTELVSLPVTSRCLSSQEVSSTVQQLLSCVARSSQSSHEVAQQAIVGLTRMAAAGHTDLLEQAMAVDLLTGMRQLTMASKVAAENVAAACAQAVQVATAGCNTQQQALICQTACQQLTQCCQQLQSITPLNLSYADPPSCPAQTGDVTNTSDAESIQRQVQGANEGRQASTTAVDIPSGEAMLPRLHPTEQMKPMLDCLIRLAMGVSQNSIQQAAMTAAAALVNKWPAESSESLREGIVSAVSLLGLSTYRRQTAAGPMQDAATDGAQASSSGRQDHTAVSFTCLSWLIKGICMAGLWTLTGLQLMDIPLSYLSSHQAPASEQPLQASHAVMKTEQGSFPANGGDHTGQAGLGSTDGQQPTDSTDKRQQGPLLLALACLLKGTPAHISKADLPGMVGLLLTALDVLQLPGQCRDKGVLRGALRSVQAVMKESTGRSKLEAEVTRLVATLTSLASYQDADIRILSLQCLVSLMDLPYHLLHPLRKQVVATVMLTVDDNMRRVRQQAVKCLSVWSNGP